MDSTTFNYVLTQFGITGVVVAATLFALYKLGADLAKLRTDLQQQISRDLLNKRFDAYGRLWATMAPLAIYSDDPLSSSETRTLAEKMSSWYFAADGGMFLTARAREFYFALQDVLEASTELKGWKCVRRPTHLKKKFRDLLNSSVEERAGTRESLDLDLDHPEVVDPKAWRDVCKAVADRLRALPVDGGPEVSDIVFVAVQQVSSALRSILAFELHTRLEHNVPHM